MNSFPQGQFRFRSLLDQFTQGLVSEGSPGSQPLESCRTQNWYSGVLGICFSGFMVLGTLGQGVIHR